MTFDHSWSNKKQKTIWKKRSPQIKAMFQYEHLGIKDKVIIGHKDVLEFDPFLTELWYDLKVGGYNVL